MPIFFDLESYLIARARLAPKPICAQWGRSADRSQIRLELINDCLDEIVAWLLGDEVLVGVNPVYDLGVLAARYPSLIPYIFAKIRRLQLEDLSLRQKFLDIALGKTKGKKYSMEAIGERFEIVLDKGDTYRLNYPTLDGIAVKYWPAGAVDYCHQDVWAPAMMYELQEQLDQKWIARMGSSILHPHSEIKSKASWALHLMSCHGVHTNAGRVEYFADLTRKRLERLEARLVRAGLVRGKTKVTKRGKVVPDPKAGSRNKKAAQAYMERLCARRGIPVPMTDPSDSHPSGQTCLDLDACTESGSYVLEAYAEYGSADNLLTKVENLRAGVALPLQASFDALKDTGRTSCYLPREPLVGAQLQNPPREKGVRECFEPRPGKNFFDADFSSAELHTLAQVCLDLFGFSRLAETLNAGMDVHLWFGAKMLGIPYEEALRRKGESAIKEARQRAKPANFGFPGGMGPRKFVIYARQYGVILTVQQAAELKQMWLEAFPEMKLYFEHAHKLMAGREKATFRHARDGHWRGGVFFTALCNSKFQELTARGATMAAFDVAEACYAIPNSPLYGCRPWAFVHDQILAEGPIDQCPEAAEEMSRIMVAAFNQLVPDVPTKAEPCVMEVWSKEAEAVRDANGRLVAWNWTHFVAKTVKERDRAEPEKKRKPALVLDDCRRVGAPFQTMRDLDAYCSDTLGRRSMELAA